MDFQQQSLLSTVRANSSRKAGPFDALLLLPGGFAVAWEVGVTGITNNEGLQGTSSTTEMELKMGGKRSRDTLSCWPCRPYRARLLGVVVQARLQ